MKRPYGSQPLIFRDSLELEWDEYMHYLYLPVKLAGDFGLRIPERLMFLLPTIHEIIHVNYIKEKSDLVSIGSYIYITARRGYATPGNPINRPGWHTDGFGTDDVNYIWSDRWPTQFALQHFDQISDDHVESIKQFEDQLDPTKVVTFPNKSLLRLDSSVVHAAPEIPNPGGDRSFLKISFSKNRYNLKGNSHNYLFRYNWHMWDRDEIRNDPSYAGGDAGPQ